MFWYQKNLTIKRKNLFFTLFPVLGNFKDPRLGDGYCDDMLNWDVCNFDEGDCCGKRDVKVNHMFCQDCFCLQNYPLLDGCFFASVVGNGICDDLANTEECSYDGGKFISLFR